MTNKVLCIALLLIASLTAAKAQNDITEKPRISGYFIGQYQDVMKDEDQSNGFNIRIARLAADGILKGDFAYKIQGQVSGNVSSLGSSVRLVDAFAEWQRYNFLKVKLGQFKRPFTFENPMNPIDQGFMGYAQVINNLAGFNDRTGCHASNGRDIGLQLQGDVKLWNTSIHYQVGVFNGQGINTKDMDSKKDLIGGVWVTPLKGFRIGAFGWTGTYARTGNSIDVQGNTISGTRSLRQNRYALGAEYKEGGWQVRSEYIHSTGWGFTTSHQQADDAKKNDIKYDMGNKADGIYALLIAPCINNKLRLKVRYDLYRKAARWSSARTQYEIGMNYSACKNVELQAEYALVNDRSLTNHYFNLIDCELCVRF